MAGFTEAPDGMQRLENLRSALALLAFCYPLTVPVAAAGVQALISHEPTLMLVPILFCLLLLRALLRCGRFTSASPTFYWLAAAGVLCHAGGWCVLGWKMDDGFLPVLLSVPVVILAAGLGSAALASQVGSNGLKWLLGATSLLLPFGLVQPVLIPILFGLQFFGVVGLWRRLGQVDAGLEGPGLNPT
jgi:hypothetical protein